MPRTISFVSILVVAIVLFTFQNAVAKNDPRNVDQIQALKSQFFYFDDAEDIEGIMSLFTEDAVVNVGTGEIIGKEAIRAFFEGSYAATAMTRHLVTNPLINVHGRKATGKWYLVAYVTYETDTGSILVIQGTVEDTFKKVEGEWKISSFVFTANFVTSFDEND